MDPDKIISFLKEHASIIDVAHKISFRCYRNAEDGSTQEVNVDVFDHGSSVDPGVRYYCRATSENGKTAAGNSAESVEVALAVLHWGELDKGN